MNSQSLPIQYLFSLLVVLLLFSCNKQDADGGDISSDENLQHTLKLLPEDSVNSTNSRSRSKEEILAYFDGLIANKQLIVGQHCGDGLDTTVDYYNRYIDVLADHTGRHVALMGADLGFFPSNEYPVQALIDHWNKGGLVTVSWHADNPFTDGYNAYCNTAEDISAVNLRSLLKDASRTTAWTNYRTALDNIAGALQKLRDAGVTVIWRPFHEMNGDFFWWGINAHNNQQTNAEDYKRLWIDLYNTLTVDYGLDNLIWTYAVMPYQGWNAEVTAYYPGSDYVDLVGMDYYGVDPEFPDYDALKSLGKTIVMSETGPIDEGCGNWDMMHLATALRGKAAYFLQWHSWSEAAVAIKDNKNVMEMMNSEIVITRDELFSSRD